MPWVWGWEHVRQALGRYGSLAGAVRPSFRYRGEGVAGREGHFLQSVLLAQDRALSTELSLVLSLAIEVPSFHSMVLGIVPSCLASNLIL